MRRISLFLIITIASLASIVSVIVVGYYALVASASPYPNSWISQLGGMMSQLGGTQAQTQTSSAPYFGVAFVILVGVAVIGVGGLVYFIAFPEIKISQHAQPVAKSSVNIDAKLVPSENIPETPLTSYAAVLKTLNKDEFKVVEVLKTHEGKYLQKYIRSETGLSRLKTHRVVARLAEMGIVSTEKNGNTNTVMLENWLK